jgi:DNA segregation ATPase FtsK/SpoIIIE, S-DNA-T family
MSEPIYIDRPPRIQPELPFDEITIPDPPENQEGGYTRLIQVALPLITIIGYVLVSTLGGNGRSPMLLIPMALSVVASVIFSIYSFYKERQRREAVMRGYESRIIEMNKEMHNYHDMQRRFAHYNYPDLDAISRIVKHARTEVEKADRSLRSEVRLWERRVDDDDFGVVRLGIGTLPSTVTYVLGNVENFDDPQVRSAMKLADDSRFVSNMPVIISLRQPREDDKDEDNKDEAVETDEVVKAPITPTLGIAGEQSVVYEFTQALLAHFLVFHAPMDARLYVLAARRDAWTWTDHVPHCQADEQNQFCCFISEMQPVTGSTMFDEDEGGELEQFLEGIRKVLAQRKIQLQERDRDESGGDPTLPFLLVVIDLLDTTYDPHSVLNSIESNPAISILLEEGGMLGAAVIFLVPERSKIPSGCHSVIEIEKTTPATNSRIESNRKLHFRYAEVGVNSFRYVGVADSIPELTKINDLAQQLASLKVRQGSGANLVGSVSFLDMMGWRSLQELQDTTVRNWQMSTQPQRANWLRARIGLMSGNKLRTLMFSAKRDGVHGMVAGSTGSGKSELLISLIMSMAVTYDPSVLNFVLVDYKGGGAFSEFKDLPHCVSIITNLAGDGVTRMFTAIQSELKRRQALNSETGTKNIVEYRQKGLHQTHRPYPYLFIIIDEFAEMIADRAEYKSQLESITRVGRAQGVSLILAAQRPSGVTDQMRSNIKFRICLRVETAGESREMLRRSDAAFLPTGVPGRGYLQVGNEEIELIQVAYTGERYVDPGQQPKLKVIWPDRDDSYDSTQEQEPPELYKALIELLGVMAKQQAVDIQRAPWPDFLPPQLALSELLTSADPEISAVTSEEYLVGIDHILLGRARETELTLNPAVTQWLTGNVGWIDPLDWKTYAVRPVVGLIDNPYAAQQLPLIVDLPRGHAVVFGASGWGKTTFIRTLIVSLAATHSPDHLHMYILDLGGRNLGVLAKLPHVGALIIPDAEGYEERVEQLLRVLEDLIEKRKTILSNAGLPDIYQYNQAHPDAVQPAVIMAIDNFVEFVETFGNQDDDVESVLDKFVTLARQSRAYGIHFVISVNHLGNLSNQVYSLFTERFTLKLTDPSEYRAIVGGTVPDINDIPGRGYTKIGRQPLSFQVAVPLDLQRGDGATANEVKELDQLALYMQEHIARSGRIYNKPTRVDALPKAVLLKQLLAREHRLELNQPFLDRLETITRQQWARSIEPAQADWLKVTIGVVSGNRPRPLHLEAKQDGVHGMIAGGTGSGKSELLMTLIVGLALNYSPTILNFVLVDYKGGGAFEPFKQLPHCVDMITNLNRAGVQRMFTAINAEMQRRQEINAQKGVKDIVEYRARGLHKAMPYPHLFIIIDEYAEMITDNPEFRDELDRITRVGRSLGVNLLLASQRPTGVSDQMRANIKFRICLRVEGIDTSREMLRRSDAAFLPSGMPGRGFLQVGNENIELIQVAYTGEKYEHVETPEGGEKPSFYEVIVQLAQKLCGDARPRTPWPPALPTALTMSYPLIAEYLARDAQLLITLGRTNRLTLNPFAEAWLAGNGTWHGIDWNTSAMRAIVGLLDNPHHAQQGPLVVDFTRGHAVLFGASGWGKTTFMRSLVVSLACTHSPDEFQAHVLDLGGRSLEVLGALPHVGTIITPDERGYEERVQQLWRELNDLVDTRKKLFTEAGVSTFYEYNRIPDRQREPAILVVLDNMTEFIETFGEMGQKARKGDGDSLLEAFVLLARQGKAYGLHFVISASRLNALSSKLYSLFTERYTLRLSEASDYSAIVGSQVSEIEEITGRGYTRSGRLPLAFQVALPPNTVDDQGQVSGEIAQIRMMGERMQTYIKQAAHPYRQPLCIAALPKSSSYRQVLREVFQLSQQEQTFLDELKAAVQQTWERHASAEHADWLEVTLGITSGNRLRPLSLEAKKDGVHGMIAGGTGSGKSELLMTLIVGLALNYSPDILNFVLVDYKGGGAFKPFEGLPHCVDIVTNLNKSAVDRMFTAINAEIRRRQALNAETGTKDIVEYRRKGWHKTHQAYPHLFIIIDEYAEMIDANPEYRAELESITRVGRAQGINLILASQRPKGVSDQMRANIKLRLCLRVEQTDTSQELLRRPDAAFLPNGMPGRGYLQVGNETIELIQVSYTGEAQPDNRAPWVTWPERVQGANQTGNAEIPRLYDMAVTLASELTSGQQVAKPWPSFLPDNFSLQTPLVDATRNQTFFLEPAVTDWLNNDTERLWAGVDWQKDALYPIVGLVDDPAEAAQYPLRVNLRSNHLAIFGDAGLGKTTLLRTLLISLMATHSPSEFQAYVLDLGGRNLRSIEAFPHIGAVIHANDENFDERLQRLMEKLSRMTEQRQQVISEADVSTIYEFNARYPEQMLPPVVVVIDNYVELQENYDDLIANVLLPMLRRSLSVGIAFVVTCNVPNNIASKVYNMFGERLTFKQTNFDRYIDIVGRGAVEIDDLPGRGYVRRARRPLLFHAAQAVGLFQPDEIDRRAAADELRLMADAMRTCLGERKLRYTRLDPIDILPGRISLDSVVQHAAPVSPQRIETVIGQTGSLETALFDLNQSGPHFMIAGPPRSGKTTTLYNWVLSLAERYPPERVKFVLVDMQRKFFEYGGKQRLNELPHVLTTVSEVEQMHELVAHLQTEATVLANQTEATYKLFVIIDNYDEFNEEIDKDRNLIRDLATLARRYGRDGLHFIISGMLDGSKSDFQRRIQAANSGIGLQTAQALDTFRVARMPAALRRGELPLGRGYMVRSGQPTLIQVAVPWASSGFAATNGDFENEAEQLIQALDSRVQHICACYPDQRANWASGPVQAETTQTTAPQPTAKTQRMLALIQAGMRKELTRLQDGNGNGAEGLLTTTLVQQMDVGNWHDEAVLMPILKDLWIKEQVATGVYSAEDAEDAFNTWDIDSVMDMLEHFLSSQSAT